MLDYFPTIFCTVWLCVTCKNMDNGIKKYIYAVIEFQLNEVMYISAAPLKWVDEENKTCLWPPKKGRERKVIMANEDPKEDWILLTSISVLGKYATYKEALYYEKKKTNSETDSAQEEASVKQKRKVIKNSRYRDDSISPPPRIIYEEDVTSTETLTSSEEERPPSSNPQTKFEVRTDNVLIEANTLVNEVLPDAEENFRTIINDAQIVFEENNSNDIKIDKLINIMVEVKVQQGIISDRLLNIETILENFNKNKFGMVSPEIENELLKFPFEDVASIQQADGKLKESQELQQYMFNYLQFIGGSTNKLCINRCLEKVFSNFVGQFCCWTGKRGNLKIADLKMIEVIKRAVRVTYPQMTNDYFEKQVMIWFHHSKTRYLRRSAVPD